MRTDESLLTSWLPRHRVLHLSGRNLLLGLLCVLVGLALLGWCLYWLNDDRNYKIVAYLMLPVGLGFVGLGIGVVLRFRFWLRLTQLFFGFSAAGCFLSVVFMLRLVIYSPPIDLSSLPVLLPMLVVISGLCVVPIRVIQRWMRETHT
ncbi:hypothetical protein [Hymenobacter jeollabukensis]|uniref:Uncharacterized protein n=1 Tax=Hymenobacter jeollabukensis TaxID=2025313 RepID=A0A5R8WQD5_9BACT|nr:hypothetical protein [Hymenobacter jeollabukensis]TLM92319.1 hypothetical protein FDY95_12865 [Hymenobacter jeollabukensis]